MAGSAFKRWGRYLVFLGLLPLCSFTPTTDSESVGHPFFVSVTEINYNTQDKTLEISCKLFTDDFEKALVKANAQSVDLYQPRDKALLEKQIADYVRRHLTVSANQLPLKLEYVGYEIEEQSTYSYFQVSNLAVAPRKINVQNSILFELFDKQISILHVVVNGARKSTKLDYPQTEAVFEF